MLEKAYRVPHKPSLEPLDINGLEVMAHPRCEEGRQDSGQRKCKARAYWIDLQ